MILSVITWLPGGYGDLQNPVSLSTHTCITLDVIQEILTDNKTNKI